MKTCLGWTLLELLITLAILSITLSFATGSYALIQKARYSAAAKEVTQAIQYARTQALGSHTQTYLCPSSNGRSCVANWAEQLVVYRDLNGDKLLDSADETLRLVDLNASQAKLKWRAFRNKRYLEFTPAGMTDYQNGTFTLCPLNDDVSLAKAIILNVAGRPYFGKDSNGNGITEYSNGNDVSCE